MENKIEKKTIQKLHKISNIFSKTKNSKWEFLSRFSWNQYKVDNTPKTMIPG